MKAEPGAEAREIHYEETNWKARPDFSPDGSRMVYSSYLGRQWHQLWVMPANGGDAFPISYGDWDETNVRWSPDGKQIGLYFEPQRKYRIVAIRRFPAATATTPGNGEAAVSEAAGSRLRVRVQGPNGQTQSGAQCPLPTLPGRFYAPSECVDPCGRWIRPRGTPVRSALFPFVGRRRDLTCLPGKIGRSR